ncbi:type II toxin-antitoxin system RelE/ParE family toxin [Candidatus Daviesbacteria bacterium]|nr:type II toxin-antitoxin system RelE/ParE family toxin [Candidatus Daviesbacteria bacterium]
MEEKWEILLYRTEQGGSPVQEFINSLEIKAKAKVESTINLLREFGTRLGLPHFKKIVGSELWEMRLLGSDNIRVLYISVAGRAFLLLHGFKKKKDKTPGKEIKVAEARLVDHRFRSR